MKAKTLNKYIVTLVILCGIFSCKKSFLEVNPKGKLIAQNVSDYNLLLNNLSLLNTNASAQVPMGDEVAAVEPFFSGAALKAQRLFRWDDIIYEPNEDASELKTTMENIYTYNKIINEVPDATGGTPQGKLSLEAEARAGRAWTYFYLINLFGKPYNAETSTADPGLPIVTVADVNATTFSRASVKEVYDFIVNDLTTAIPNLPAETTHRLRMSRAAANAILAKVYIYMGKNAEALPLLNDAFTDAENSTIAIGLYNYNDAFAEDGFFMPIGMFGPSMPLAPSNEENIFCKQASNDWAFANNEFVVAPQAVELLSPSDLRLNFYSNEAFFGPQYPNGMLRRTAPGAVQFGMTVPDLYLLRAECKARLDDLQGAVEDLETLRTNRMPEEDALIPVADVDNKLNLLKFIMNERVREFALQGYRWFDMRRLSVDPLFTSATYTHTLYGGDGNEQSSYILKPERLVLRLPQKVINQNPGMENNP